MNNETQNKNSETQNAERAKRIKSKVKCVGVDVFGRKKWKFGETGKVYIGKNARQRAINQGFALTKSIR